MNIAPYLVASHISKNPDSILAIRYEGNRGLARTVDRREALMLAAGNLVRGEVDKRGSLKYLVALVSIRAISRMLNNVSREGRGIAAEDNYTVSQTAGGTFYHNGRSLAYGGAGCQ